jgi:3-dehydroquinate dehydratase-2
MNIIVINGPNLNMLGARDEHHYGSITLKKIETLVKSEFPNIQFLFFQSNIEGEIVEKIQKASKEFNGLLINPGGYAHTSVAIRDALADIKIPKIEVHLSHLVNREYFRQDLITAGSCNGYISGFKENSYLAGVFLLNKIILEKRK